MQAVLARLSTAVLTALTVVCQLVHGPRVHGRKHVMPPAFPPATWSTSRWMLDMADCRTDAWPLILPAIADICAYV